ncbi:MAG: hypothetical protein GXO31_08350 [Epsilonproteobacteria bacterium]|nr:hypothetical protein [Campylobacterota bacterium]
MILLKYVGNKPIISPNGISFEGKEDKYEYLEAATHLLKLLSLVSDTKSEKLSPSKILNPEEIIKVVKEHIEDIENIYKEKIDEYKRKLLQEKNKIEFLSTLSEEEKEVYKKNFDFMKEYLIQRETNKIIYEEVMNKITSLIDLKNIKEIKTPFSKNFLHILKSLKDRLENMKNSSIDLSVKLDKENPYLLLKNN